VSSGRTSLTKEGEIVRIEVSRKTRVDEVEINRIDLACLKKTSNEPIFKRLPDILNACMHIIWGYVARCDFSI
jgi:hypothetical protein